LGGSDNVGFPGAVDTTGVLAGKNITQIQAGSSFSAALDIDGSVFTWGVNGIGELGINSNITYQLKPGTIYTAGVLNGVKIAKIAIGCQGDHVLALSTTGGLYTWGGNGYVLKFNI
jgi:alpha-tubulin suppressor-like RCC1 family protein